MKKHEIIFLFFTVTLMTVVQAGESSVAETVVADTEQRDTPDLSPTTSKLNYLNWLKPSPDGLISQAIAPLYAGYGYTPEEQEAAHQKIVILKKEIEQYKTDIRNSEKYHPEQDTDHLKEQLKRAENELHKQQLITGQAWSSTRKAVVGTVALATVAALGFAAFKSLYHVPPEVANKDKLSAIPALKKRLENIKEQKDITVGGYRFPNPAYSTKNEQQARQDLDKALLRAKEYAESIPYESPKLVNLDDEDALWNRYDKIERQKRVYIADRFYDNPNFNEEDERVAREEWKDAQKRVREKIAIGTPYVSPPAADPHDVEGLRKQLNEIEKQKTVSVYGSYGQPWKNANFNEEEYNAVKALYEAERDKQGQELAENTPYKSPKLIEVSAENKDKLRQRLDNIKKQKKVYFSQKEFDNPNYNEAEERFAEKQYEQALQMAGEEKGRNKPYKSPGVVLHYDENTGEFEEIKAHHLDALGKRLKQIEKQKLVPQEWYYGRMNYENPNFNKEDYRVAKEQYEQALKLAVDEYASKIEFKVPDPIKPYNGFFDVDDLWQFKYRLKDIKDQQAFIFKGQKYLNPQFDQKEYLKALKDYVEHVEFYMNIPENSSRWYWKSKEKSLESAFPYHVENKEEYISQLKTEIEDLEYQNKMEKERIAREKTEQEQKELAEQENQNSWWLDWKNWVRFGASGGG